MISDAQHDLPSIAPMHYSINLFIHLKLALLAQSS